MDELSVRNKFWTDGSVDCASAEPANGDIKLSDSFGKVAVLPEVSLDSDCMLLEECDDDFGKYADDD